MGTGYRVLSEWRMFPRVASVLRTIFNDTPWRFKMLGDSCHTKSSFLSQLLHTVILNKHPASEFRIIYSKLQICKNNPTTSRCCIHYYLSKRLDLDLWTFVPTILQPQTQRRLHSSVRIARRSKPFAANWKRFQYLTSWWSWDGSTHQAEIAQKKSLMLVVAHCLLEGLPQGWTPSDWIRSEALKSCHAWKMLERGQLLFWI